MADQDVNLPGQDQQPPSEIELDGEKLSIDQVKEAWETYRSYQEREAEIQQRLQEIEEKSKSLAELEALNQEFQRNPLLRQAMQEAIIRVYSGQQTPGDAAAQYQQDTGKTLPPEIVAALRQLAQETQAAKQAAVQAQETLRERSVREQAEALLRRYPNAQLEDVVAAALENPNVPLQYLARVSHEHYSKIIEQKVNEVLKKKDEHRRQSSLGGRGGAGTPKRFTSEEERRAAILQALEAWESQNA